MLDRRDRILTVAQQLLDEGGVTGFTIRRLCERADVSPRTIYYSFANKEEIVAAAIEHHMDTLRATLPPAPPSIDLQSVLQQSDRMADYVVSLRRYAAAMVEVFFSPNGNGKIHESLTRISNSGWIDRAESAGVIVKLPRSRRESLVLLLTNAAYANIGDFVSGRISEWAFRRRAKSNMLTICFSALRPKFRAQAAGLLRQMYSETDYN